jgi:peptide/nickel transport system ATP-binding protein
MGAIPTLVQEADRLVQIPGSMPRLSAIPPGCPFHPRCSHAWERCLVDRPEPIQQAAHRVACHLYDENDPTAAAHRSETHPPIEEGIVA